MILISASRHLAMLFGIISHVLLSALPALAAPRIQCDLPTIDIGSWRSGEPLPVEFKLRNVGDSTLNIGPIKTSCSCTVSHVSLKDVPPSGETTVKINIDTNGFLGSVEKNVIVSSNDTSSPLLKLTVKGHYGSPLVVTPGSVVFNKMKDTSAVTRDVVLSALPGKTLSVSRIEVSDGAITATLKELSPGSRYSIAVTYAPEKLGRYEGYVKLELVSDGRHSIKIPVSAFIAGEVAIEPNHIALSAGSGNFVDAGTHIIRVGRGTAGAFEVLKVEVPGRGAKSFVKRIGEDGYSIRIENLSLGNYTEGDKVRIFTDNPKTPTIEVRVVVRKTTAIASSSRSLAQPGMQAGVLSNGGQMSWMPLAIALIFALAFLGRVLKQCTAPKILCPKEVGTDAAIP